MQVFQTLQKKRGRGIIPLQLYIMEVYMKTCVSTYSFHQLLHNKTMDYFQIIDKVAEMGFDAIEMAHITPPDGVSLADYSAEISAYIKKAGLGIASYTVGGNMLVDDLDAEVERLKGEVDIAVILGSPVMRHDAAYGVSDHFDCIKTFDSVIDIIADGCRRVTEYAASKGVQTCFENHGFFAQDADRCVRLIEKVNNKNFGLLCDMGNFSCVDEVSPLSVAKVTPLVKHVHAKDMFKRDGMYPDPGKGWFRSRGGNYLRCTIIGHGDVNVRQCLTVLKNGKYDGYVSIEFEGIEEPLSAIAIGLENLKRYIAEC